MRKTWLQATRRETTGLLSYNPGLATAETIRMKLHVCTMTLVMTRYQINW